MFRHWDVSLHGKTFMISNCYVFTRVELECDQCRSREISCSMELCIKCRPDHSGSQTLGVGRETGRDVCFADLLSRPSRKREIIWMVPCRRLHFVSIQTILNSCDFSPPAHPPLNFLASLMVLFEGWQFHKSIIWTKRLGCGGLQWCF